MYIRITFSIELQLKVSRLLCSLTNKFFLKQTFISNSNLPAKLDKDAQGGRESLDFDRAQPTKLQHFSFKLRVHFNKWIGSDSMATALMSIGSYSTELTQN